MYKLIKKILILLFVIIILLSIARLLVGGGEDTWICKDGRWVKHGVPRAPMPEKECQGKQKD